MPVSLMDLAPADERREIVTVGGKEIEIRGLTIPEIGRLCKRFPDLRTAMFNATAPDDVRAAGMLEAWPAILVLGIVQPADCKASAAELEAAATRLPQEQMLEIGAAILRFTNPEEKTPDPLALAAGEAPLGPAAQAALDEALALARATVSTTSAPLSSPYAQADTASKSSGG